jgi:NAD(P)-dependent dehydrogenase (short-subunit alcohol dehydrogenase family)
MTAASGRIVVIAGGTGNVGTHLVRAFLVNGDTVAVPSRSAVKIEELRHYLGQHISGSDMERLHTFVGDVADPKAGPTIAEKIRAELGQPRVVIASLGHYRASESLLHTPPSELEGVLEDYLYAHFAVAQGLLSTLRDRGGSYVFVNGPLAFDVWEGSALVSIATAAQHMLFRSLARELAGSNVRVVELVNYAFIRDRQTQPSSVLSAEAMASRAIELIASTDMSLHGQSVHVR